MDLNNKEVILTIHLEGCATHRVESNKRSYDSIKRKPLRRHRLIHTLISSDAKKRVRFTTEQVMYYTSFAARPSRYESKQSYMYWLRMSAMQRLDHYCRVLAENDNAISYDFEVI